MFLHHLPLRLTAEEDTVGTTTDGQALKQNVAPPTPSGQTETKGCVDFIFTFLYHQRHLHPPTITEPAQASKSQGI